MLSPLEQFNAAMNFSFMGMPHGGPISTEELEATVLRNAVDVLADVDGLLNAADLEDLANALDKQGVEAVASYSGPSMLTELNNND